MERGTTSTLYVPVQSLGHGSLNVSWRVFVGSPLPLEGLARGLEVISPRFYIEVISPRFESRNWRFFPCTSCQRQGHEVKEAISLILVEKRHY